VGASLDAHPGLVPERLAASGSITSLEAALRLGQRVRLAGVRYFWRRTRIPSGEALYFTSLEDLDGMMEIVISQSVYSRSRTALSSKEPILVEGTVEFNQDLGEPFLRAQRIEVL
jgi:DNA polymerase III alpha subunit